MATITYDEREHDIDYSVSHRSGEPPTRLATKRNLSSSEKQAHRSRYSRGQMPAGFAGAVRRREKRYGL